MSDGKWSDLSCYSMNAHTYVKLIGLDTMSLLILLFFLDTGVIVWCGDAYNTFVAGAPLSGGFATGAGSSGVRSAPQKERDENGGGIIDNRS